MPAVDLLKVRKLFDAVDDLATHERTRLLAQSDEATSVRELAAALAKFRVTCSSSFCCDPKSAGLRTLELDGLLATGSIVGDFEIVRLLGRGASGVVYLARQTTLDRFVAIKVTRNVGHEASAMAPLEHRHIVQVYSETIDSTTDTRIICMQYVPGVTLAEVIRRLHTVPREELTGATILTAIDDLSDGVVAFDLVSLRDRELLARASYVTAVCWLVARLADALHFAHERGVLHHDIKPGNVLIDRYGRPYLADFGVSTRGRNDKERREEGLLGGTPAYMAPERCDSWISGNCDRVSQRSDIYSLGVILREMLELRWPSAPVSSMAEVLRSTTLAGRQRLPSPSVRLPTDIPLGLQRLTVHCLTADPTDRVADAGWMAKSLDGCGALETARARLPSAAAVLRFSRRFPAMAAALVAVGGFLPHVLGNVINPAYNALILFPRFSNEQKFAVIAVAACYGAIIFPLQAFLVVRLLLKPQVTWWRLQTGRLRSHDDIDATRRQLVRAPTIVARLSVLGWLPLLGFIPAGLRAANVDLSWGELGHFSASVVLCLLILAPYAWFLVQYAVVRFAFADLWENTSNFKAEANSDLLAIKGHLRWYQLMAGVAPLFSAAVLLAIGPDPLSAGDYFALRALAISLIVAATMGLWLAIHFGRLIRESIDALVA